MPGNVILPDSLEQRLRRIEAALERTAHSAQGSRGIHRAWTPGFFADGTTPAVGTGGGAQLSGTYVAAPAHVDLALVLQFGTSGMSAGTGDWYFPLPNIFAGAGGYTVGLGGLVGVIVDSDTQKLYRCVGYVEPVIGLTSIRVLAADGLTTRVGAGNPITWAASDTLQLWGTIRRIAGS